MRKNREYPAVCKVRENFRAAQLVFLKVKVGFFKTLVFWNYLEPRDTGLFMQVTCHL
jgi:hypothetical protein